jgi:hypothetical protein
LRSQRWRRAHVIWGQAAVLHEIIRDEHAGLIAAARKVLPEARQQP